jgi:hypothetical protein
MVTNLCYEAPSILTCDGTAFQQHIGALEVSMQDPHVMQVRYCSAHFFGCGKDTVHPGAIVTAME